MSEQVKTKSRLTMFTAVNDHDDTYASFFVIENTGDFSSTLLENAVQSNLPQYNLNPPWTCVGEDVPLDLPIDQPSERVRAVLKAMAA